MPQVPYTLTARQSTTRVNTGMCLDVMIRLGTYSKRINDIWGLCESFGVDDQCAHTAIQIYTTYINMVRYKKEAYAWNLYASVWLGTKLVADSNYTAPYVVCSIFGQSLTNKMKKECSRLIILAERHIVNKLGFSLSRPTPYDFVLIMSEQDTNIETVLGNLKELSVDSRYVTHTPVHVAEMAYH